MTVHSFPALGFDPAPGEPAELDTLGADCARFAAELADHAQRAAALRDGFVWNGEAATAFRHCLEHVPQDLGTAGEAFAQAGGALRAYGDLLRQNQLAATDLERLAAHHRRVADDPTAQVLAPGDLPGTPTPAQQALDTLGELQSRGHSLHDKVLGEARHCNRVLQDATRHAPRPPGWLAATLGDLGDFCKGVNEALGDFVRKHAGLIAELAALASKISSALATLAMIVGPIPVLGEAVGSVAFLGAMVAGTVALVGHGLLTIYAGGGVAPVVFDAVALATTAAPHGVQSGAARLAAARGWELGTGEAMGVRTALGTLRHPGAALAQGAKAELTFPALVTKTISYQFDLAGGALGSYDLAVGLPTVVAEAEEAQHRADEITAEQQAGSLSSHSDLGYTPRPVLDPPLPTPALQEAGR